MTQFTIQTTEVIPTSTRSRSKSELRQALAQVEPGQHVVVPVEYFGEVADPKRAASNAARAEFGTGNYAVREVDNEGVESLGIYNTTNSDED
jgi:hypothetical protein